MIHIIYHLLQTGQILNSIHTIFYAMSIPYLRKLLSYKIQKVCGNTIYRSILWDTLPVQSASQESDCLCQP